ncbi:unnamed protein product [Larinioides sclopetarius]|uniref:Uncharacterized protein n=1 Tax=Larinioides sclopetarius TaxID=280406 RepID=A0AAV2B657_9ARAC
MESVNQTIIDVLHFISVIQDVFAQKRQFVETLSLQEYNSYVKEWKQEQKKTVKPLPKEREPVQVAKQQVEVDNQITIAVEELALADALLEKARNIRIKNKETKDCNSSTSKSSKLELQHKMRVHKNTKELSGDKKAIPRSKSTLISSTAKAAIMPRSKSASTYQVTKDIDKVPKKNETITKINSTKNKCPNKRNEQRTFDKCNSAVLSNQDLKDFKKLFSDRNDFDRKANDKLLCIENCSASLSSDCFQFSNHQNCFPTYRKFQNELKRIYLSKTSFKMHPGVLWYPYLSAKNKNYLCSVKQFDSFDSFKKTMEILHKIQESLVWIDILNFIGKALSKLQLLDKNDENVVRVCSYLSSICRKDLQRAPLLDLC